MIYRVFAPLLMLLILNNGCALASSDNMMGVSGQNCMVERDIGNGNIGPIRLGDTLGALREHYQVETIFLPYSDDGGYAVSLCGHEAEVVAEVDEANVVITLSTTSPSFETQRGAAVGMSLERLQALHPEGMLSTGVEEGGWFAFRLDDISGYFEFSLEGVSFECLRNQAACGDELKDRSAIRYWGELGLQSGQ